MSTLTDAELATLTPEEREAIQDSEYTETELAAMRKLADDASGDGPGDDDDDDEGDDEGDDNDEVAAAAIAEAKAPAADAEPAAEPAAAAGPSAEPAATGDTFVPRYDAALPADFDAQVKTLTDEQAALKTKFQAGELDFDEYEVQRDELVAKREALTIARAKAEISAEMTAQTQAQRWQAAVVSFAARTAADGGFDYRKDAAKARDLDTFVRALAADEANADQPHEWFLTEAHRRVMALHGGAPAPKPEPSGATAPAAKPSRRPPLAAVPPSLANVPGGEGPGDVTGEFADIDALDGTDLESAIARMTPAQRERYSMSR